MPFQEFTLVNEDYCEVMADINTDTGKLIDLYCYSKDVPKIEKQDGESYYKMPVLEGKNPLFVHFKNKVSAYKLLLRNGFIFLVNEEEESNDITLIEKSLKLYDLQNLEVVY